MERSCKKLVVYLGTLAAMFFWGISFVWTKIVFQYYGPFTTVLFRLIISSVLLALYARFSRKSESVSRKDWPVFLLLAFLEPFCYFIGESLGLLRVSPTLASIMIGLIPVVSPFFAYLFYRERLSLLNIAGLAISFLGLAVFTTTKDSRLEASTAGLLFLLFAVVSAVGYSLVVKNLSGRYRPLTIVRIQNMIGGLYFLPLMLGFELKDTLAVNPPPNVVLDLVMLAILGSSLAFIFITVSIRELGIGRTNVFTNIIPVITAISAYYMLNESFTQRKIIGMAVIISGIFLSQLRKRARTGIIHER
jgi:drug/metabolite transporter (DMT)-like permease